MQKEPMPYSEFQKLAVASASQYLAYLDAAKGFHGRKVISVYEIQRTERSSDYLFTISERLSNPDFCEIWIDGFVTDKLEVLTLLCKNSFGYQVRVRDTGGLINDARTFSVDRIKFVSDMRFLVIRLKNFYQTRTFSLSPPGPTPPPPLPEEMLSGLSEEQFSAAEGIFEAPISYINGAPGTGKTKMVLSRCVLRYILDHKRVFLLAPTNNAVEQMLRGILPVLRGAEIDLTCVYRMGTSSEEFAQEYPQVVGDAATDTLLESLNNRRQKLLSELENARTLERKRSEIELLAASSRQLYTKTVPLFHALISLLCSHKESSAEESRAAANLNAAQMEHTLLLDTVQKVQSEISEAKRLIQKKTTLSNRLSYILWRTKERERLLLEIDDARRNLTQLESSHGVLAETLNISSDKLAEYRYQHKACSIKAAEIKNQSDSHKDLMLRSASTNAKFHRSLRSAIEVMSIDPLDQLMDMLQAELLSCTKEAEAHPVSDIQSELKEIDEQLNDIGKTAKQEQKKNALVLAGTIDAALAAMPGVQSGESSKPVSHVFLDEAGYTSLIRGMTAFSFGAPITLLGDHKQLAPICEMNRIDQEHAPVCLWSLSISYFPELLYGNFVDLYLDCYCNHQDPCFDSIKLYSLNTSYRFGPSLAEILAKYIYSPDFKGVGKGDFEIAVIDARCAPGPFPRSNSAEAQAIARYIANDQLSDFAVLAPYNGQVRLIQQTLPRYYRDSVMTVHRAQGREWDTVIFSIADTNNKYFTDSRLPVGRRIINTAISRAKHRLILVCDTSMWSRYSDQIITDLIQQCKT